MEEAFIKRRKKVFFSFTFFSTKITELFQKYSAVIIHHLSQGA